MEARSPIETGSDASDLGPEFYECKTFMTGVLLAGLDEARVTKAVIAGVDEESQATLLLRRRKDVTAADDDLQERKEAYRARMTELDAVEGRLNEKRLAMQATVDKFRPFLEENAQKCEKAAKKERAELASLARIEVDIKAVSAESAALQEEWSVAEVEGAMLRRYAEFLRDVANESSANGLPETFEDPRDILARHATLLETNRDLHRQAAAVDAALTSLRREHSEMQSSLRERALMLSAQQATQARELDRVQGRIAEAQAAVNSAEAGRLLAKTTWGNVVASLRNLYRRTEDTAPHTTFQQLPGEDSSCEHRHHGTGAGLLSLADVT